MAKPKVSNWGRWGRADQRGMLNLLTPQVVLRSLRMPKQGKVYNLAVPLESKGPQFAEFHKTWRITHYENDPKGMGIADDVVIMEAHSGTHIDGIGHAWREGLMYNGKRWGRAVSSKGIQWGAVHNVGWIITRGVMLDVAAHKGVRHLKRGEVVTPDMLDAAAKAQGTRLRPGDVLLIRTGWSTIFDTSRPLWDSGEPGPDGSIAPWLKAHDVLAVGADTPGVEAIREIPMTDGDLPLHTVAMRDLGVYLIENLNLEELARDKVYEFLFIAAPLRLMNATGAGMTPLAVV
ncbi:MAG: cyclase family protein [Chloroflexi bacterium]|nr:cyclase family protein [Chloroflexota bacterium]